MDQLTQLKCTACRKGEPTVTDEEINEFRPQVPDWNILEVDGEKRLEKVFRFDNFVRALAFTNKNGVKSPCRGGHIKFGDCIVTISSWQPGATRHMRQRRAEKSRQWKWVRPCLSLHGRSGANG